MNYRRNEDKWPVAPERPLYNAVLDGEPSFSDEGTTEPLTPDQVKEWLRITGSTNDSVITMLITASRREIERELQVSLITRTVMVRIKYEVGESGFKLPYGPVRGSVTAYATDGEELDSGSYEIRDGASPGDKYLMTHFSEIKLEYEAGYTSPGSIPADIKLKILDRINYHFRNRGDKRLNSTGQWLV